MWEGTLQPGKDPDISADGVGDVTWALAAAAAAIIGIVAALSHAMGLAGAATTSLDDLTGPSGEAGLSKARAQVTDG